MGTKQSRYCGMHRSRLLRHGSLELPPREYKHPACDEPECGRRAERRGYCRQHAQEHFGPRQRNPVKYGKKDNPYISLYRPDHPNAFPSSGYVPEHVLIITEILGRALYLGENVHHKNGVRSDNRPENLELWVTSQPAGQRPEDLVAWAHEILERYGNGLSHD
jgi:hypothetical protein